MQELYESIIAHIAAQWSLVAYDCPFMVKGEIAVPLKNVEAGLVLSETNFENPSHVAYLHIRGLRLSVTVNCGNATQAVAIREELLRIITHMRTPPIINVIPTVSHDAPLSQQANGVMLEFQLRLWKPLLATPA